MKEFIKLLNCLRLQHKQASEGWRKSKENINTKKILVSDVLKDKSYLIPILKYKMYLDTNAIDFLIARLEKFEFKIEARIKTQNSIESKIAEYAQNNNSGKIPLKKCLNDILGVRIITKNKWKLDNILKSIEGSGGGVKCIDSSKNEYNAIHLYFKTSSNLDFQWELQIWSNEDERSNRKSHSKYKQRYTRWEEKEVEKDG